MLLHQLKGVQSVAGAPHQAEAKVLPGRHHADRLPQFVLVIRHNHRVRRFSSHGVSVLSNIRVRPAETASAQIRLKAGISHLFSAFMLEIL